MKVGIIVLNYNSYNLSKEIVKKSIEMDIINKIVLIDNNSEDDFDQFVNELNNNKVLYIKNNENGGYAKGNNIGLKYLYDNNYDIGFIVNPDVDFREDTIEKISYFLHKNKEYAICGCKRTLWEDGKTRQYWYIPSFKDTLCESLHFLRRKNTKKIEEESLNAVKNKENYYIDVEVVPGAFFGINLSIIQKLEYLDENTFLWYEENILATKVKDNNYKEAILLDCSYKHNHIKKGHGNKNIQYYLKSKKYYCEKCLKINFVQKIILNIVDFIGNIEEKIIISISKVMKK